MNQGVGLLRPVRRGLTERVIPEVLPVMSLADWGHALNHLGLNGKLQELTASSRWKPSGDDVGRWTVPVVEGISVDALIAAFGNFLKIPIRYWRGRNMNIVDERGWDSGPYQVEFHRTTDADPDLKSLSVRSIQDRNIVGSTVAEYLTLRYALKFVHRIDLDNRGTGTICSGSRVGDLVPVVEGCVDSEDICIGLISKDAAFECFRVRESFLLNLSQG